MNGLKVLLTCIALIIILVVAQMALQQPSPAALFSSSETLKMNEQHSSGAEQAAEPKLTCRYYVDSDFNQSVSNIKKQEAVDGQLLGGIVTHHLLASSMIAPFFDTLSESKPELVFIVGPNHKRVGQEKINTGSWDWQTPFGVLEADHEAVESLVESCNAGENFSLLEVEHSVSSLIPYVKYYLPEAKVVPVLLHGNYGMEASLKLAEKIRQAAGNRKWIVIGSIDFSHYLTPEASREMDKITLKAIEEGDLKAISNMGNDNLDSPPSLMTVLSVMKNEGDHEMKITGHSDATEVVGTYSDSTTSYFTILFYKK